MTEECQPQCPEIEREIRLYYFTVYEVCKLLHLSDDTVKKKFNGKMIWYNGKWMISPTDVRQMREKHETDSPAVG